MAGGVREGACPGHNFTIAPIPPTSRSRRLQPCTAVVDALVNVAIFAGRVNDAVATAVTAPATWRCWRRCAQARSRSRCAQEARADQCGWLGASKDMVFVGAPLVSLPGTMSTRTRSRGVTPDVMSGARFTVHPRSLYRPRRAPHAGRSCPG